MKCACYYLLFLILCGPVQAFADLVVLQYHHIADDTPNSTSTSVSLFKQQMQLIGQLGLKVVPLRQATLNAMAGTQTGGDQVAITFDDSLSSIYTTALPILEKHHYPFTVFINTGAIDRHYRGYMTWKQVKALAENPLVSIGNHTSQHQHLIRAPGESQPHWKQRVTREIDQGELRIKEETGLSPQLFAYPYGEYSPALEALIAKRHWLAYGQESGAIGRFSSPEALPRFPAANAFGTLKQLKDKLLARNFPLPAAKRPDPVIRSNPPVLDFALPSGWSAKRLHCYASEQGAIAFTMDHNRVSVRAPRPFTQRRFRYDCTYPAGRGHYYWLSQPWVDRSRPKD